MINRTCVCKLATIFSLDQEGVKIKVKVLDCITDTAFEDADIVDQFIVFYKPDGIKFEKQAELVVDTENPTESFVQYHNTTPEESIFDLIGPWEYAGKIELVTTDVAQTSQRKVFWVR